MLIRLALIPGIEQSFCLSVLSGWDYWAVPLCPANCSVISSLSWGGQSWKPRITTYLCVWSTRRAVTENTDLSIFSVHLWVFLLDLDYLFLLKPSLFGIYKSKIVIIILPQILLEGCLNTTRLSLGSKCGSIQLRSNLANAQRKTVLGKFSINSIRFLLTDGDTVCFVSLLKETSFSQLQFYPSQREPCLWKLGELFLA